MRRIVLTAAALALAAAPLRAQAGGYPTARRAADSTQALAFFRGNIAAIHHRDRAAYLRHYLQSPRLARVGPGGPQYGYQPLAAQRDTTWPDTLVATHFEVVPLSPGVVYGTYRYRVAQGGSSRGVSERMMVRQPDGSWKVSVSTAFGSPGDAPVPAFALTHATVIDGTGAPPRRDATVVMRGGKVECVGDCRLAPDVEVVDARGRWIVPGLIDAHVHFSQTGWADGRPDALDVRDRHPYEEVVAGLRANPERFGRSLLCSGVTAAFDVGGYPWTVSLSGLFEPRTDVPRVAAAGPLLSTVDHWLNLPGERQFVHITDPDSARAGARYLKAQGSDAVKVWFIRTQDVSLEEMSISVRAAGEEARRLGIPLIVHATGLLEAKEALRAGAKLLVHSVDDLPVDQEFLDLARSAGTVYCPTLTVMRGYEQLMGGVLRRQAPAFEDPNGCVDAATRANIAETAQVTPKPGDEVTEQMFERFSQRNAGERRTTAANLKKILEAGIPV